MSIIDTQNGVTALQIARRLGYVSVEQVLQTVTSLSDSSEELRGDFKYSMVGPEKMEEHSISESEEEQGRQLPLSCRISILLELSSHACAMVL